MTDFETGVMVGMLFNKSKTVPVSDWTFPNHWPELPDPKPNQVIMYVEAEAGDVAPLIGLYATDSSSFKGGTINYGDDGHTYQYPEGYGYNVYHVYQTAGQYIITITAASNDVYLNANASNVAFMVGQIIEGSFGGYNSTSGQCKCIRAIKVGSNIRLGYESIPLYSSKYGYNLVYLEFIGAIKNTAPTFSSFRALKKIKIGTPPESFGEATFNNCNSLEKVDGLQSLKTIPTNMFSNCYALRSVSIPEATSEDANAFNGCYSLKVMNAPKLAEITANEFSNCFGLQSLTLASGCVLNGNKFENCPQLYPKL